MSGFCLTFAENLPNMRKLYVILTLLPMVPIVSHAQNNAVDSMLSEVVVTGKVKENVPLRYQPLSSSEVGALQLRERGVQSIKDISTLVPNLFIPSYGSRLTTSVYVRGVGSRVNTPAVGMYVDGVPWVEKSAFDFNIDDVQRIDVLRGPQSTLYGRNTVGGLIFVTTKNPMEYTGTDITLGAAMYNSYKASATHYHRVSDRFGFSSAMAYNHQGGFYENKYTNSKVDHDDDMNFRMRLVGRPSDVVRLDFQASYEYSHQGAYPYELLSVPEGDYFRDRLLPQRVTVNYNRKSAYDRHLMNLGLTTEHTWDKMVLSNVLAFQYLKDDMNMDQDFSAVDLYTLAQRQNSRILSEEIALKNRPDTWRHWDWTTGVSGFSQWLTTQAPVVFREDGLTWLNAMMNRGAAMGMQPVTSGPMTMNFIFDDQIQGEDLAFTSRFETPVLSGAVFHQSTVRDLFNVRGLNVTLGLRLDYERLRLKYDSWYDFSHRYSLKGHLVMPSMERDIVMVPEAEYNVNNELVGKLKRDYLQLLPKVSVQYMFANGNVYGTISRGYRSGGYNVQMFSELLQSQMQADIMTDVAQVTIPVLEGQATIPAETKERIKGILMGMASRGAGDVAQAVVYKPEYAWNYEVGGHLDLVKGRLKADGALFFTRVTNQQITQMAQSGLGRVTTNAGRSRSLGGELALQATITSALTAHASYGYTHATFRTYTDDQGNSLRGNYVPFMPRHTLDVGARYRWDLRGWLQHISWGANYRCQGKIYWTEDNAASQSLYGTLDSRVTLSHEGMELSLWGNNLTNKHYQAFYFESMSRSYVQKGFPLQVGVELRIHL